MSGLRDWVYFNIAAYDIVIVLFRLNYQSQKDVTSIYYLIEASEGLYETVLEEFLTSTNCARIILLVLFCFVLCGNAAMIHCPAQYRKKKKKSTISHCCLHISLADIETFRVNLWSQSM